MSAKANATYISKTTTNEIIKCCGEEIVDNILKQVNTSKYFSVIFDETTDVSHISQLSLNVRYLDIKSSVVKEDFIGFIDLHKANYNDDDCDKIAEPAITGEKLGKTVVKHLENLGLNLLNCVGIGCDGCSVNMSEICGAAYEIKKKAIHSTVCACRNHALNLALAQSSKTQSVRNILGTIKEVAKFFKSSAKRNYVLKDLLGHQVKSYCETRWVERHESLFDFQEDLPKIDEALQAISTWNDASTASKASCLHNAISNCEFIITLFSLTDVLSSTVVLSKYLQEESVDIVSATNKVEQAIKILKEKRTNCDKLFSIIFHSSKEVMEEMDVEVRLPRRTKKQVHRSNYDCENNDPETYFKRATYIPVLEDIVQDMEKRFTEEVMKCFALNILIPAQFQEAKDVTKLNDSLSPICEKYSSLIKKTKQSMQLQLLNEILLFKCGKIKEATHLNCY
ncbi:hypothetical protein JTE90_024726 [Oedothorax gibbosus]|uniref:DUF4371 domain-containing protein n=1 Tax=Oedothorax gibbosus TaxID=931172 RepID=A0AAV6UAU1_9ARAC|nr:hypothetical protein JTE90_024726 [Oedothorax gibbosus]